MRQTWKEIVDVMKLVCVDRVPLPYKDLHSAFDVAFGESMLRRIHGPDYRASPWVKDKRKVEYHVDVDAVPKEMRKFFCGDRLKITTTQHRKQQQQDGNLVEVKNRMKLHCVAAEFVRVKPTFTLQQQGGQVLFSARIEHHAILPPPLCGIVEHFMSTNTQKHIDHYVSMLVASPTSTFHP